MGGSEKTQQQIRKNPYDKRKNATSQELDRMSKNGAKRERTRQKETKQEIAGGKTRKCET